MPTLCVVQRVAVDSGEEEAQWRVLQAVLPEEEHMLATNRKCGRRRPIQLLDTDFGGAVHGTLWWVMKEGVRMEVMHVRRKDMKEYQRAGLHHAEVYKDKGVVEWDVYKWMLRRARGHETRARCDRLTRLMWKEWVAQWGIKKKAKWRGGGKGAEQEKVLDRGEREGWAYCCVLGWDSKGPGGRCKVRAISGKMYRRICAGETTSQASRGRGTSAEDAQKRRGRCRGGS